MAERKGLESAVEFTKHVMTLAGAGIAFIASINASALPTLQRVFLLLALIALGTSLAAGLFVWSRAAKMLSAKRYNLEDRHLEIPGRVNVILFGVGVIALGVYVILKLVTAADLAALEQIWKLGGAAVK